MDSNKLYPKLSSDLSSDNAMLAKLGDGIREAFPIFSNYNKTRLCFLDSAASTQKPKCVIDALASFYLTNYANIHRGAYALSATATDMYESARTNVAKFIGAKSSSSVVFTRGTTESINLVSYALEDFFTEGDTILLSIAEHHSNILPFQFLAKRKKLNLVYVNVTNNFNLDFDDFFKKVQEYKPKLIAITMCSNVLGSIFPIEKIAECAKKANSLLLFDGAQYVPHAKVDVENLGVDFLCFSGHKMYAPTGIGVLYAKKHLLEKMKPFQGGGEMISSVSLYDATFADIPNKFEAGTPAIAEAIGLSVAIDFINSLNLDNIRHHEEELFEYAISKLKNEEGVKLYSSCNVKEILGVISFNIDGIHPHDFASIADSYGVQLRSGFHCAMPLLNYLKTDATNRISFGVYSDKQDIDALLEAIQKAKKIFIK